MLCQITGRSEVRSGFVCLFFIKKPERAHEERRKSKSDHIGLWLEAIHLVRYAGRTLLEALCHVVVTTLNAVDFIFGSFLLRTLSCVKFTLVLFKC